VNDVPKPCLGILGGRKTPPLSDPLTRLTRLLAGAGEQISCSLYYKRDLSRKSLSSTYPAASGKGNRLASLVPTARERSAIGKCRHGEQEGKLEPWCGRGYTRSDAASTAFSFRSRLWLRPTRSQDALRDDVIFVIRRNQEGLQRDPTSRFIDRR